MIKKIFTLSILFLSLFMVVKNVYAEAAGDTAAKKLGITFPIAELGGCTNYQECHAYCEDPANSTACINFAKSKGFYKDPGTTTVNKTLEKAKQILGCDSVDACKTLCSKQENFDKCHDFAQNNGLSGGYKQDPRKSDILAKAKEVLGCDSYDSCKTFCSDPANKEKCTQFARSVNLNGGEQLKGPGGCDSAESCRKFCSDLENKQTCIDFSKSHQKLGGNKNESPHPEFSGKPEDHHSLLPKPSFSPLPEFTNHTETSGVSSPSSSPHSSPTTTGVEGASTIYVGTWVERVKSFLFGN